MFALLFFVPALACPSRSCNSQKPGACNFGEHCMYDSYYHNYCCTSNVPGPSPSPGGYCPWMSSSGQSDVLVCNYQVHGQYHRCNGRYEGWDCCMHYGGRRQCPLNTPIMCNSMTCGGGHDYCCASQHCHGSLGGERQCGGNNVVHSAPSLGAAMPEAMHDTAEKAKQGAADWNKAHPNAKANVQKGVQRAGQATKDWGAAHPEATAKMQRGVQGAKQGVQNWRQAHPNVNVQTVSAKARQGMQNWRAEHPDVTVQSLIDQLVEFMTPERRAKAKTLLTTVVELLMDEVHEIQDKLADRKKQTKPAPQPTGGM